MPEGVAARTNRKADLSAAMREKRPLEHYVIPIDQRVKKLLLMFVSDYPTYSDAARAVGLNRDTIARYLEGNSAVAAYAFQRIAQSLLSSHGKEEIDLVVGKDGVEQILADAVRKNGAVTDHVSYAITPAVREVLDAYARLFVNRAAAARALRINPRTFAAYFKATISSFPRDRFWRAIEILKERGWKESAALEKFNASSWDEVLVVARKQAPMSQLDDEALQKALIDHIRSGDLKIKTGDRPLFNACRRRYGNLTVALRQAMSAWVAKTTEQIEKKLEAGEMRAARALLDELGEAIRHYMNRAKSAARIPTLGSSYDWQTEAREYLAAKERSEERLRGAEARSGLTGGSQALRANDLYRQLLESIEANRLEEFLSDRRTFLRIKRAFGSVGRALSLALAAAAAAVESRVRDAMERGDLQEAVHEVAKLERYLRDFVRWARGPARKRAERVVWRREVDKYVELRNRMKSQILEARHLFRLDTDEELRVRFHHLRDYRSYLPEDDYALGELLFHPVYGFGRVINEEGRGRMTVLFQPSRERVTLVRNL
jgi:hypothetical protein